jgi:hypothetical protein
MAGEVLKDASGVLADLPDNSSGLITPQAHRSEVVSVVNAVAFLEDDPAVAPQTLPMTDGVPFDLLQGLAGTPGFVGQFWALDGNGRFVPDYVPSGVTVEPGTTRLVSGSVLLRLSKAGGGTAVYEFQGTEGGVLTGNPVIREIGTTEDTEAFSGDRLYDVFAAGAISLTITPVGTSDDLILHNLRIKLVSSLI